MPEHEFVLAGFIIFFILFGIGMGVVVSWDAIVERNPALKMKREHMFKAKLAAQLKKQKELLSKHEKVISTFESDIQRLPLDATPQQFIELISGWWSFSNARLNYLHIQDGFLNKSPLVVWMDEWLLAKKFHYAYESVSWREGRTDLKIRTGSIGWTAESAFHVTLKLQHEEWEKHRQKLLDKQRKLRLEVNRLCKEFGLEIEYQAEQDEADQLPPTPARHPKTRVDIAREELKQHRVRVAELEEEILNEEQKSAAGPLRRAAGVSTDKN